MHVILEACQITKEGFTSLVQNSPNLMHLRIMHVYTQRGNITEVSIIALEKNFSQRNYLFVVYTCRVQSEPNEDLFSDLLIQGNMDFWHDAPDAL